LRLEIRLPVISGNPENEHPWLILGGFVAVNHQSGKTWKE